MAFDIASIMAATPWWWIPLIIWEAIWKGIAMWKAARHSQLKWFIAILVINSVGILPIVYLKFFQKKKRKR